MVTFLLLFSSVFCFFFGREIGGEREGSEWGGKQAMWEEESCLPTAPELGGEPRGSKQAMGGGEWLACRPLYGGERLGSWLRWFKNWDWFVWGEDFTGFAPLDVREIDKVTTSHIFF